MSAQGPQHRSKRLPSGHRPLQCAATLVLDLNDSSSGSDGALALAHSLARPIQRSSAVLAFFLVEKNDSTSRLASEFGLTWHTAFTQEIWDFIIIFILCSP